MAAPAPVDRADTLHETLKQAGLDVRREGASGWRASIDTWGDEIPLSIRLSENWLELSLDPFLELPAGPLPDALRAELLRLNRDLHLMKFGISATGTVVLCAEMLTDYLGLEEVRSVLAALAGCIEEHRARLGMLGSGK